MYNLPEFNIKAAMLKILKNRILWDFVLSFLVMGVIIVVAAGYGLKYFPTQTKQFINSFTFTQLEPVEAPVNQVKAPENYISKLSYEQAIIDVAKNTSPSVVSIVISKNVPVYDEQYINPFGDNNTDPTDPFGDLSPFNIQIPQYVQKGTELQEVGAGSGFIVSADGLVLTNKHVVSDSQAQYTVFTNDGKKYTAKVLALDPVQDLAVVKIDAIDSTTFKPLVLGDSSGIQIGQTVIAIGNALGEFSNTVSVGVVSGLQRTISASDQLGAGSETLEGIIQTDAAINAGNSGGPLVNLDGKVIGINTAMAQGAQSIGFALPINIAKRDIDQVTKTNKIVYPFLGVRYLLIDDTVKQKYKLSVDYGALVLRGDNGEAAITKGSAAEKAGIKEKDVILSVNGEKISQDSSMAKLIQKYNPGDTVTLHILRDGKEQDLQVTLGERSS